jgi:2,3-bisphosphoglycerate-independent phosphoglycerate mutase
MLTKSTLNTRKALAEVVQAAYSEGQVDYSLEPLVLVDEDGKPIGRIKNGDGVIFCCRRGEREVQLTEAFTDPDFTHFERPNLQDLNFAILTLYHEKFKHLLVAFAPTRVKDTLGELVSHAGLTQMRIAESEKFAHITFFFNGGASEPFSGEEDVSIPSPKGTAFEWVPELSLPAVIEQVYRGIKLGVNLIAVNFANGDVIGHTSNNEAKVQCASIIDSHLGDVIDAALLEDYLVMITADHGNLEEMLQPDGRPHVAHTANPVPLILIDPRDRSQVSLQNGKLADIAPTILSIFGLQKSKYMDGSDLAPGYVWNGHRRLLLVILDGWGIGKRDATNPIFLARTPVWDALSDKQRHARLDAAGEAVGLKAGKAGNSEAGHMNIGAGRVVLQDDVRLDLAMRNRSFFNNEILIRVIEDTRARGTNLHLIGLLSEKSSHGTIDYPLALLKMAKQRNLEKVYLHLIFDGRSTEPGSVPEMLEMLDRRITEIGIGKIVSGIGRGIALDRDGNYDKTQRAFDALVLGNGRQFSQREK